VKKVASFRQICLVALIVLLFSATLTAFSFWQTGLALHELRSGRFSPAAGHAQLASPWIEILSGVTLRSIPDLEFWRLSLEETQRSPGEVENARTYFQSALSGNTQAASSAIQLKSDISHLTTTTQELGKLWDRSLFLHRFSSPKVKAVLDLAQQYLPDIETSSQLLLTGHHSYVVLLQNSDELRPTGGFMGSYAKLELDEGVITTFKIYDIYEPDGQFVGYIEAPHGVKEYLSSGNGLRLPDANWSPDFPSSATDILHLFAGAKEPAIDGVIAVNLEVIQHALDILGPIPLPDFQQTVTSDNLPDLARADRVNFFPGSQQKKQFLQALLTQIEIQVQQLTPNQLTDIATHLAADVRAKNVQFYSTQPEMENLFHTRAIDGAIPPFADQDRSFLYFFPVEANVGINKVNRHVTREIKISGPSQTPKLIEITSTNADPQQDYINYQRILLSPTVTIDDILLNGKSLPRWDYNVMAAANGSKYQEVGFLAPTAHLSTTKIEIKLTITEPIQKILIQKQSGVNRTPLHIDVGSIHQTTELESDLVFDL
jgi:hypothetical protein